MPVRIYDIAKKLGIESKVVIAKAKELGITTARVASSTLDRVTGEYLERQLLGSPGGDLEKGLRGFSLGNFKAFADTQSIPIRPLTLIFGANSSGKSSVIHGLLLAHEAVRSGRLDMFKTDLGGDSVDLGGFRQYVHRREANRRVEWVADLRTENLQGNAYAVLGSSKSVKVGLFFGVPLDNDGRPRRNSLPRLMAYEIAADGRLLIRLSHREDAPMQVDRLDTEMFKPLAGAVVVSASTTETVTPEDLAAISTVMEALVPALRFACDSFLPERLVGHGYGSGTTHQLLAIRTAGRSEQLAAAARLLLPRAIAEVVSGVNAALKAQLERFAYLGPLRSFPPRHLAFIEDTDRNWFAGGGYAWDVVRRHQELREKVNEWLSSKERLQTPYRLEVEQLFTSSEVRSSLGEGFRSVVADIAAPLMGEARNVKIDATRLIEARDEIEYERRKVQKALSEAQAGLNNSRAALQGLEESLADYTGKAEKLRTQRDVLAHSSGTGEVDAEKLAAIDGELSNWQKAIDAVKLAQTTLKDVEEAEAEKESALADRLKRLETKKVEIFGEVLANLDDEALVGRLYEGIRSRSDRGTAGELVLMDCRTDTSVTHRDVGIGISQVLPVLVHAYADKGKIVAIEQPEIHLHPKLQADLGDLFIASALGECRNTFLLETHSEHLILRILRRVRQTTENSKDYPVGLPRIKPEDISVVFVEPTPKGSVVRQLPVTPDGDFGAPWPGGFFADRLKDLP